MAAMRKSLMDEAFPNIRTQFNKAAKQQPPWLALFDALGKRPVDDVTRQVRIINVKPEPLPVPNPPPGPEITQITGDLLPHVRVRTVETLQKEELDGLISSETMVYGKVAAWAELALKTANLVLFFKLHQLIDVRDQGSCTLNDLPAEIREARRSLRGQAMALLVSEARHADLTSEEDLSKKVLQALKGGTVAPVAGLPDSRAYILRQGAGDVVVEIVQDPQPHWDFGDPGSVELIALHEFVLVADTKVPAYELTLLDLGRGRSRQRRWWPRKAVRVTRR